MELASIELGAGNNYKMFISMVTSRTIEDILDDSQDMKERL